MTRARMCPRCRQVIPAGQRCQCGEAKRKAIIDKARPSSGERGYDADWRAVRRQFLKANPTCCAPDCGQAATEADHIVSVAEDPSLRLHWSNLRPYCKRHHSQRTARDQSFMSAEAIARTWPNDLLPSAIPLTIVCGPPGSGKTTWVREQATPDDLIIDLDDIKATLAGTIIYSAEARWTGPGLEERNRMLRSLSDLPARIGSAWFIVSAPEASERRWWQEQLGGTIHLMDADEATCVARINADWRRVGHRDRMIARTTEWFAAARGEVSRFRPPKRTAPPLTTKLFPKLGISDHDDSDEELFFG